MNHISLATHIQICRLCGGVTEDASGIFYGPIPNLHEKINNYLPITVRLTDTLPLISCTSCIHILLSFEQLVLTCIEANTSFEVMQASTNHELGTLNSTVFPTEDKPVDIITINEFSDKSTQNLLDDSSDVDNYEPFSNDETFIPQSEATAEVGNEQTVLVNQEKTETSNTKKPRKKRTYPKTIIHRPEDDNADYIKVLIDEHVHYKCTVCEKLIRHKHGFKQHFLIHTDERPFPCEICGHRFRYRQACVLHVERVHHGIKKVSCDICGLKFSTNRCLRYHQMKIHTNEKPHMCDICGKSSHNKYSFQQHLLIHRNDDQPKPQCELCKKEFRSVKVLAFHMRTHNKVPKPKITYTCNLCPRKFITEKGFLRHKAAPCKTYPCDQCSYEGKRPLHLQRHIRREHKKPTETDPLKSDEENNEYDKEDMKDNNAETNKEDKGDKKKKPVKSSKQIRTKRQKKLKQQTKVIRVSKLIKEKLNLKKQFEMIDKQIKNEAQEPIKKRKSLRNIT